MLAKLSKWLTSRKTDDKSVVLFLIQGYLTLTIACFIILLLPFSQNEGTSFINHIFFAVSVATTTGLAPADFSATYNMFGQASCLFFIQLGGLGYMALSSFIILEHSHRLPSISAKLLKHEFNLPSKYPLVSFIRSVFAFTVLIECIGTIILYFAFKSECVSNPLWSAIFHSVSSFCTAGFSLFSDSLVDFQDNNVIIYTIAALSFLGSIGFIVLVDFMLRALKKRKSITLTSKLILVASTLITLVSSCLVFISDDKLFYRGSDGFKDAFFQCISAHTTVGFNSYDMGALNESSIFIVIIVMIIGASPAGTGGGIKTTSISALFAVLSSTLRQTDHITFLSKEIPARNVYLAVSSGIFYSVILVIGTWMLLYFDGDQLLIKELLFEAASALSTVGLSTGITSELSVPAKLTTSALMFVGRLGVLTFGLALVNKAPLMRKKLVQEEIAI